MSKSNDLRRNEITKIILAKEKVRVEELASALNVTAETVRSDLTFLEAKGILYRTHGGATLRNSIIDIPMDVRIRERAAEKKARAEKRAAEFPKGHVSKAVVRSKTAQSGRIELNYEIRLKSGNTDFITALSEMEGVNSAVLVSYNGDYLG